MELQHTVGAGLLSPSPGTPGEGWGEGLHANGQGHVQAKKQPTWYHAHTVPLTGYDTDARCQGCYYALRGLIEPRCPECGRPFDPDDPKTMYMGLPPGRISGWFLKPIGWPMHTTAILASLFMLRWAFLPHISVGNFTLFLWPLAWVRLIGEVIRYWRVIPADWLLSDLLFPIWSIIGAVWLLRFLARVGAGIWFRQPRSIYLSHWQRWLWTPLLLAFVLTLWTTGLAMRGAFWISRPWLNRLAQQALSAPCTSSAGTPRDPYRSSSATPHWAGLYRVDRIDVHPSTVRLHVWNDDSFGWEGGFLFSSTGQPPPFGDPSQYRPLGGGWYLWQRYTVYISSRLPPTPFEAD